MKKLVILCVVVLVIAVGVFVYFEFPLRDEGVIFTSTAFSLRVPSKVEAKNSLTSDTIDHFFEKISVADMQLQMKTDLKKMNQPDAKKLYQTFLENKILNFKSAEIRALKLVAGEIFKKWETKISTPDCNNFNIVKISTTLYGANVFFTRNKTIFITDDFFKLNLEERKETLAHELSHILSRYIRNYKNFLYPAIQFKKMNLEIGSSSENYLTNPDGANSNWYFSFPDWRDTTNLCNAFFPVLLLVNNREKYGNYVDCMGAELENINPLTGQTKGVVNPRTNDLYQTFFKATYDITYTIHPDEIIADLFAAWLLNENTVKAAFGEKKKVFAAFDNVMGK